MKMRTRQNQLVTQDDWGLHVILTENKSLLYTVISRLFDTPREKKQDVLLVYVCCKPFYRDNSCNGCIKGELRIKKEFFYFIQN